MSSYVAVVGKPTGETVCIFGLTPQEVRYLQSKFPESMKHESGWNPPHGIRLECACIVILNALGYIGFKVIGSSGDSKEYLWTMERNLDMDTQYQSKYYDYQANAEYEYSPKHHYHSSGSLSKYQVSTTQCQPGNSLAPPKKNERRHSLGGKLAAALHL